MKHGMYKTKTYLTWVCMHRRLRDKRWHCHANYSHLSVDPSWKEFINFYNDMGERPEGKTLDRIDNSKGYYKDNCRWATPVEQANNRRLPKGNSKNKSGHTGIHWDDIRQKWFVQVRRNNKTTALGRYTSLGEAVTVRETYIVANFKK